MVRPLLQDCLGLRALLPSTPAAADLPPAASYRPYPLCRWLKWPSSPHTPVAQAAITAISQQSRFHAETLETSSRDVDLRGVTLAVGDVELLADAHLRLAAGQRYGLIGRCDMLLEALIWRLLLFCQDSGKHTCVTEHSFSWPASGTHQRHPSRPALPCPPVPPRLPAPSPSLSRLQERRGQVEPAAPVHVQRV